MRFSAKEDIEAPIEHVFAELCDFETFERSALRRGAEIERLDSLKKPGVGMAWHVGFMLRGKHRELDLEMTQYDPPNGMVFTSRSPNMGGSMVLDLVALSRGRTRIGLEIELKPKNLSARLLVQSLKLARGNLSKRLKTRVADFSKDMEERYRTLA